MKVFIADRDGEGVKKVAQELNANTSEEAAWGVQVDVADWESQRKGIDAAVRTLGHIDYVFPIAGITEQPWIPKDLLKEGPFVKPNLKVLDVNGYGAIYSASLAIEQFRRQEPNKYGFRGKSKFHCFLSQSRPLFGFQQPRCSKASRLLTYFHLKFVQSPRPAGSTTSLLCPSIRLRNSKLARGNWAAKSVRCHIY